MAEEVKLEGSGSELFEARRALAIKGMQDAERSKLDPLNVLAWKYFFSFNFAFANFL